MQEEHLQKIQYNCTEKSLEQVNSSLKFQEYAYNPNFTNIQRYQQQQKDESNISDSMPLDSLESQQSLNLSVKEQQKSNKTSSPNNLQTETKHKRYLNRSSNNSHKKYAAAARKNLFKYLTDVRRNRILEIYKSHRSSRIYYFCLIWHALVELQGKEFRKFVRGFVKDIKEKIIKYTQEIFKTKNQKLKHFRTQEIDDLKNSLLSFKIFLSQNVQKGIQCLYKKNKKQMMKLPEYQRCVLIIKGLQKKYQKKIYNFDPQKIITAELQRKIRQYRISLPEAPQFIEIQKPSRGINIQIGQQDNKDQKSYRMTRRQHQNLINQLEPTKQIKQNMENITQKIIANQPQKEKSKQNDFMNKKTSQQEEQSYQKVELISIKQTNNQSIYGHFPPIHSIFSPSQNQFVFSHQIQKDKFPFLGFQNLQQMPYTVNKITNNSSDLSINERNAHLVQFSFSSPNQNLFEQSFRNPMVPNFPPFQHPYMPFNPHNPHMYQKKPQ